MSVPENNTNCSNNEKSEDKGDKTTPAKEEAAANQLTDELADELPAQESPEQPHTRSKRNIIRVPKNISLREF